MALLKHYKNQTKLAVPESKELVSEGVFEVAVIFFELRLQSLAICDFEVAAIRVTKGSKKIREESVLLKAGPTTCNVSLVWSVPENIPNNWIGRKPQTSSNCVRVSCFCSKLVSCLLQ